MTTLKHFAYATVAIGLLVGCGDDDPATTTTTGAGNSGNIGNSGGTGGVGGGGGGGAGGEDVGPPPSLGDQVDRMGRPAINTALNTTFADDATRLAAEDAWNTNANPAQWVEAHGAAVAAAAAIYDGVNQSCTDNTITSCGDSTETNEVCYAGIAGLLANDRLWVKTTFESNAVYLGVEADALAILPNEDAGGRRPVDDVIETSYSILAFGAVNGADDGIDVKAATQAAYEAGFPYFAAPNVAD